MSVKISFAIVRVLKRYKMNQTTIEDGARETGLSTATFWRYAKKPLEELYAMARETQYKAMSSEERANYENALAKNKAVSKISKELQASRQRNLHLIELKNEQVRKEYLAAHENHFVKPIKINNKAGNICLGERNCPVCSRPMYIADRTEWAFKIHYGRGFIYLCSASCKEKRFAKMKKPKSKKEAVSK